MSFLQVRWIGILVKQSTIPKNPVYPNAVDICKTVTKSLVGPSLGQAGGDRGIFSP